MPSSYRPRNPGHDYYGRGTYLITLLVSGRAHLLSHFVTDFSHESNHAPASVLGHESNHAPVAVLGHESLFLTPLGKEIQQAWQQTPVIQATHGNQVAVHACVCMPDHFHGVIEVLEPMTWNLGDIIQAFKAFCTSRWQQLQGLPPSTSRLISVATIGNNAPAWLLQKIRDHPDEGSLIRHLSKKQRQEYYALVSRQQQPLFDDNYDDTICLDNRHREAMIAYVNDNPRRALLRHRFPDFMQRCLHVTIGQRDYGAFGNLFLLRWARKIQVQCHRRHPVSRLPYETTDDYARQHAEWESALLNGQTVLVTPGISRGELMMKNECLEKGYPLIHLQKEPIGPYWKPERWRFEACLQGHLLILAPWNIDTMGGVSGAPADSDYSRFHNLNTLAAEICAFYGEARIHKS